MTPACKGNGHKKGPTTPNASAQTPPTEAKTPENEYLPTGPREFDMGDGWIAAGQPTADRLRQLVKQNARTITMRMSGEESLDEKSIVERAGGSFMRHGTRGGDLASKAFHEKLYDLIDAEKKKGGRVYLHCGGSNRVGAAWALYHAERKGMDHQ